MSKEINREFIRMSEGLVTSLKHFGRQLELATSKGDISKTAAEEIRKNVMEGVSIYMMTTANLAQAKPDSESD